MIRCACSLRIVGEQRRDDFSGLRWLLRLWTILQDAHRRRESTFIRRWIKFSVFSSSLRRSTVNGVGLIFLRLSVIMRYIPNFLADFWLAMNQSLLSMSGYSLRNHPLFPWPSSEFWLIAWGNFASREIKEYTIVCHGSWFQVFRSKLTPEIVHRAAAVTLNCILREPPKSLATTRFSLIRFRSLCFPYQVELL